MVMQLNDDRGRELPSATQSQKDMMPNVPRVHDLLKEKKAEDLTEVIFGDDVAKALAKIEEGK